MNKRRDRTVYRRKDKKWADKRNDAKRVHRLYDTQEEARRNSTQILKNQGGGELTIKGRNGKIRSKDTIPPGHDPNPPKDSEH